MAGRPHSEYDTLLRLYSSEGLAGLQRHRQNPGVLQSRAPDGRTVLFDIVQANDAEGVDWACRNGAELDGRDEAGFLPLHLAAVHHATAAAERLLAHGAVVDPKDRHGNTPLWRAVFASRGRGEMITLLLRHGADPDVANTSGMSPRRLAESIANYDVRRFLPSGG